MEHAHLAAHADPSRAFGERRIGRLRSRRQHAGRRLFGPNDSPMARTLLRRDTCSPEPTVGAIIIGRRDPWFTPSDRLATEMAHVLFLDLVGYSRVSLEQVLLPPATMTGGGFAWASTAAPFRASAHRPMKFD